MNNRLTIIGVDEVGRGCLSGPVVACALILNKNTPESILYQIKDSKTLSRKKREYIGGLIKNHSTYSIKSIDAEVIDKINILQASLLAMYLATIDLLSLSNKKLNHEIILDGNKNFNYINKNTLDIFNIKFSMDSLNSKAIIKADNSVVEVSAASIIAKNFRDNLMIDLSSKNRLYMWDKNFGYGTKEHLLALQKQGITKHHRKSFQPIKSMVEDKTRIK